MTKPNIDWSEIGKTSAERAHKAQIEDYKRQVAQLKTHIEEVERQLDVTSAIASKKPSKKEFKKSIIEDGDAVAVAIASDWHVEEEVTLASTNGMNEFSLEIAEERIRRFFSSFVRLTEIQRSGCKITNGLLHLGGDHLTGWLHEELQETNPLTPIETVLWLKPQIEQGIAYLRQHFDHLTIVCNYGNHGRTTKKPRHATGYKNSYEWLLYSILSQQIASDDITWQVADSYFAYVELYGKRLRFHHGDNLSYQGGIGGLTIPVEKAIASWNKSKVADLDIFGHWHQFQQNPKWISNGSLIGYNAYALSIKAAFERPQQTFFLFDKDRGRTITAPIVLS